MIAYQTYEKYSNSQVQASTASKPEDNLSPSPADSNKSKSETKSGRKREVQFQDQIYRWL